MIKGGTRFFSTGGGSQQAKRFYKQVSVVEHPMQANRHESHPLTEKNAKDLNVSETYYGI